MRHFLLALTICFAGASFAQEKPEVAAEKASRHWLELMDSGKYGESWEQAAEAFKSAVTKDQWTEQARKVHDQTGNLKTRTFKSAQMIQDPPNAPPGRYAAILYDSSFESGPATETVVPQQGSDGSWKVSGYFVKPGGQ